MTGLRATASDDMELEYLPAPKHLTREQKAMWQEIVSSKPAYWFKADSAPLLEVYCRAISHHRITSKRLEECTPEDTDELQKLIAIIDLQARLIMNAATKMRLTQQARYVTQRAGRIDRDTPASSAKPWDEEE